MAPTKPEEPAMNHLNTYLAHHEIDRRLRSVDHHRRIRWGRTARRGAESTRLSGCADA